MTGSDDLAFLFRVGYTGKLVKEPVGCINIAEIHVKGLGKNLLHHFRLVFAQKSMIDEYDA